MTLEEHMRRAAAYLKTQHPRPCCDGVFIDEMLMTGQAEIERLTQIVLDIATLAPPAPLVIHPDQTSPMTVGLEAFLEETKALGFPNSITTITEDPPGEPDWSQGDIIYQPRGKSASIGE